MDASTSTKPKRVIVVDDHPVVRTGVCSIIASVPGFSVAAEASNGQELLFLLADLECDLVILDIEMPRMNGIDALSELKCSHPGLPVLVISGYPEDQYAVRVFKAGGSGFVGKTAPPEELISAIRRVADGGRYVSPRAAERLAANIATGQADRLSHESLSDREYQVFVHIAMGHAVSEIARKLNLSVKTISTYRSRILEKVEMNSNAELTRYAIHNGIVQ